MNTNLIEKIESLENEVETLKADLLFASAGKAIRFMEQTEENVITALTIDGNNIEYIREPEKHIDWCIRAVNNKPEAFFEIPAAFRPRVYSRIQNPTMEQTKWFIKSAPSKQWEDGVYSEYIPEKQLKSFQVILTTIVKWFFYWITE